VRFGNRTDAIEEEEEGGVAEVAAESDDSDDEEEEEVPAVMRLGSGVSAEEAMRQDHAAVLAALERGGESSSGDEEDEEGTTRERCMIWGCKQQLLRCYGVKSDAGAAVGCAEASHVVCASCLDRWAVAQNELRSKQGLSKLIRKCCPACKTELRITGEHRGDASLYHMGLLKVAGTWAEATSPKSAHREPNFASALEAEVVAVPVAGVAAAQSSSDTQQLQPEDVRKAEVVQVEELD